MAKTTKRPGAKASGTVSRTRKAVQKKAVAKKKVRARTTAAKKKTGSAKQERAAAQRSAVKKRAVRTRTTQKHAVRTAVGEARAASERKAAGRKLKQSRTIAASEPNQADRALQDLAKRIVDLTVRQDDEACLALYAADAESAEAGQPPERGIEAIRSKYEGWRNMTSNSEFRPRTVLAACNTIVIEWEGRVTLAASGKIADLNEIAIHEIENGKIARERYYYNPSALQG